MYLPNAFGLCDSLPCDNSPMQLEENYQFIDFSYVNIIGDPIQFIIEKPSDRNCNSYEAKITDGEGNFVLGWGADISCDPVIVSSPVQTKIGYNENNPIVINESGKYYLVVEFVDAFIKQEFVVRQNHGGGTLDRTFYPVPFDMPSPHKQMKLGIKLGHVICDKDKVPVWNSHYKPACVFADTESELIKRGWAKLRLMLPASPYPEKEMEWTGRNVMSMMLEGTFSYNSTPVDTLDEKRKAVEEYSKQYHLGEQYLEYAITPYQYHYNVGDKVQFELLEWGISADCSNLQLRIININDQTVFENNFDRLCIDHDGTYGTFNSYSMGDDFEEFVCDKTGYYRIEVSNGNIFPPTILQNFACLDSEPSSPPPEPEPTYTLTEVHCFPNQVIYNDECIYVLTPSDEFPKDMTKYFSMVDGKIINFCEIKTATSDRENASGITLDRCFEISHYKISDVNEIEFQSTTPPTWINIKIEDLTRYVDIGSSPTFKVVESGWGNGCTSPTLEVYHMKQEIGNDYTSDDLIYKHRIVYSCPYYEPVYPPRDVLRVWDESDFTDFPTCEKEGRYLIVGDSGYERLPLDYYYCELENEN